MMVPAIPANHGEKAPARHKHAHSAQLRGLIAGSTVHTPFLPKSVGTCLTRSGVTPPIALSCGVGHAALRASKIRQIGDHGVPTPSHWEELRLVGRTTA